MNNPELIRMFSHLQIQFSGYQSLIEIRLSKAAISFAVEEDFCQKLLHCLEMEMFECCLTLPSDY